MLRIVWLSVAIALGTACGSMTITTDATTVVPDEGGASLTEDGGSAPGTNTGPGTTGSGSGSTPSTGTTGGGGTPSTLDTSLVVFGYVGEATVNNGIWTGTEALTVARGALHGPLVCEYTWQTTGATTSISQPCRDFDGNVCDYAFDVRLLSGAATVGNCATYGLNPPAEFPGYLGYGYSAAYMYNGVNYGEWFLYYLPAYSRWQAVAVATMSGTTLTYDWFVDYLP